MTKRKKILLLIIISVILISAIIIVIAPYTTPSVSIFLDKTRYTTGSEMKALVMNTGFRSVYDIGFVSFYSIDQQRPIKMNKIFLSYSSDTSRDLFPINWFSSNLLLKEVAWPLTPTYGNNLPSGAYEAYITYYIKEDGSHILFNSTQSFQIVDG